MSKYASGGIVSHVSLVGELARDEYIATAFVSKIDVEAIQAQTKVLDNGMVVMNGAVYSPEGELLIRFIHKTNVAMIETYERLGYIPLRLDELLSNE